MEKLDNWYTKYKRDWQIDQHQEPEVMTTKLKVVPGQSIGNIKLEDNIVQIVEKLEGDLIICNLHDFLKIESEVLAVWFGKSDLKVDQILAKAASEAYFNDEIKIGAEIQTLIRDDPDFISDYKDSYCLAGVDGMTFGEGSGDVADIDEDKEYIDWIVVFKD